MHKFFVFFLSFFLFLSAQDKSDNPEITIDEIRDHIKYLASDELEGRLAGSEGGRIAAEYLKSEFEKYGLLPFYNGRYFQEFEFIQSIELDEDNYVTLNYDETEVNPAIDDEFVVAPFSGSSTVTGQLAFAGYGISSSKLEYDDYAGLDLHGKIAIIMRYNPDHDSAMSEFDRFLHLE
ncbi:MAG: hypothetical protein U5K00_21040 [Melioribacteraceae bacterium]|nr:hypothetical protein [Melioribacteraceae bacterium]